MHKSGVLTPQPPLQLRGYAARGEGEPERASSLAPPSPRSIAKQCGAGEGGRGGEVGRSVAALPRTIPLEALVLLPIAYDGLFGVRWVKHGGMDEYSCEKLLPKRAPRILWRAWRVGRELRWGIE